MTLLFSDADCGCGPSVLLVCAGVNHRVHSADMRPVGLAWPGRPWGHPVVWAEPGKSALGRGWNVISLPNTSTQQIQNVRCRNSIKTHEGKLQSKAACSPVYRGNESIQGKYRVPSGDSSPIVVDKYQIRQKFFCLSISQSVLCLVYDLWLSKLQAVETFNASLKVHLAQNYLVSATPSNASTAKYSRPGELFGRIGMTGIYQVYIDLCPSILHFWKDLENLINHWPHLRIGSRVVRRLCRRAAHSNEMQLRLIKTR